MAELAEGGDVTGTDDVVERLQRMLEDYRRQRGRRPARRARAVRTGLDALDRALPHGGLPTRAVTEVLFGAPGAGAMSLALGVAGRAAGDGRPVVVVDSEGDLYPPAVARVGLSVEQLLVIRPRRAADGVWAADQSLRCPAVGAVVVRVGKLGPSQSRRLQLAAESGDNLGLIVKPYSSRERTFAAVQIVLEPEAAGEQADPAGQADRVCLVRVTVLKVREGKPAAPFIVGLDDEAGFVPVHSVAVDRSSRARRRRVGA